MSTTQHDASCGQGNGLRLPSDARRCTDSQVAPATAYVDLPASRPLTDRQLNILRYIVLHIDEHGAPPTLREIGSVFGIPSTNGVNDNLNALERKGWITRRQMLTRSIRVLRRPDAA